MTTTIDFDALESMSDDDLNELRVAVAEELEGRYRAYIDSLPPPEPGTIAYFFYQLTPTGTPMLDMLKADKGSTTMEYGTALTTEDG